MTTRERQRQRLQLMREVAICADLFAPDSQRLGAAAATALTRRRRSQLTNLETIANSSLSVADVLDYIKARTARSDAGKDWQRRDVGDQQAPLGQQVLDFIGRDLKTYRDRVCRGLGIGTHVAEAQQVYLQLIRTFVRQLVIQFEYSASGGEDDGTDD